MDTSDKHGARMADDLTKDTRAGHEELRHDQVDDARIDLTNSGDGVLDPQEAEARAEIARHLEPSIFPARTAEIIDSARENFAGDEVMAVLETLPDQVYENVQEIWKALGGDVEVGR